jgi:hypothetical protein
VKLDVPKRDIYLFIFHSYHSQKLAYVGVLADNVVVLSPLILRSWNALLTMVAEFCKWYCFEQIVCSQYFAKCVLWGVGVAQSGYRLSCGLGSMESDF